MKRSDLKVGDALWHSTSPRWEELPFSGDKAVVVDVRPHAKPERWYRDSGPRLMEVGAGVLVDLYRYGGKTASRQVVQLGHLRGPYAATRARLRKQERDSKARRAETERQRAEEQAVAEATVARAYNAGFQSLRYVGGHWSDDDRFQISGDDLDRLLKAAGVPS